MKKLGVFVAVVLVMVSTSLYSQPAERKGPRKIIEQLKLTVEQKKDFDKIHVDMEKQEIAQKAKNETARVELRQLFKADNPDKSAIEKKMNEIADLEVQLHMIKINSWFDVNNLLTPEQQKTWKKALEFASEMHHRKMEMDRHDGHSMPPHHEEPMPKK
ncbi:MAG: periplasmic heavy metal sensor [Bacteroidota bacterium]|jgi:Spy/CpxP family protein refolding chaperone